MRANDAKFSYAGLQQKSLFTHHQLKLTFQDEANLRSPTRGYDDGDSELGLSESGGVHSPKSQSVGKVITQATTVARELQEENQQLSNQLRELQGKLEELERDLSSEKEINAQNKAKQ